jgi:hypothetical protein
MTPEGHRKIREALPIHYEAWPRPEKDEDLPFVTINHIEPRQRGLLLNLLARDGLLHKPGDDQYKGEGNPSLFIAGGLATEGTITFLDLDSPASEGMLQE